MPKNDAWITSMSAMGMIEPFERTLVKKGVISYGLSSYGYDIRIADEYKIPRPINTEADPKAMNADGFSDFKGNICVIKPNSYVLGRSFEYFRIPRDILALCFGKSTYARCGVIVNVTPLEPEWEGHLTMAICNTTSRSVRIYSNEGIAQLVFLSATESCITSYADRAGKYQAQKTITLPRT